MSCDEKEHYALIGFLRFLIYDDHCSMFVGSLIVIKGKTCKVLSSHNTKDGFYYYYVQGLEDKQVFKVSEKDITASFNNGRVDPALQLQRYEFQNPCWYLGRAVVSRSMNILENSIYGFKELAGSKIYLLPHQINTIMRCLQEEPCRYMLADEVGMGKTVEAISIFKIFTQNRSGIDTLIIIPEMLKAQWKTELLLKFNISLGMGKDNNTVIVKSIDEISVKDTEREWGFVIVDEIDLPFQKSKGTVERDLFYHVSQFHNGNLHIMLQPIGYNTDLCGRNILHQILDMFQLRHFFLF